MKTCKKCTETKSESLFEPKRRVCRECRNKNRRKPKSRSCKTCMCSLDASQFYAKRRVCKRCYLKAKRKVGQKSEPLEKVGQKSEPYVPGFMLDREVEDVSDFIIEEVCVIM